MENNVQIWINLYTYSSTVGFTPMLDRAPNIGVNDLQMPSVPLAKVWIANFSVDCGTNVSYSLNY